MRKVICFGAGKLLEKYFNILNNSAQILCICDNDPLKWGKEFICEGVASGIEIVSPSILDKLERDVQVLVTSSFCDEIANQLKKVGKYVYYVVGGGINHITYKHQEMLWNYIRESKKDVIKDDKKYPVNVEDYMENVYRWWGNIYFHSRVISMLPYLDKRTKILDYGCGCGTAVLNLLLLGFDAYGIEIDTKKYAYIMQLIDDLLLPVEWKDHFKLYDGNEICFDDEYFEFVFSLQVLEHVSDCYMSVREMLRVCKKNGYLQLECPNYDSCYEKHFYIDFGKPLHGNKEEFCEHVKKIGGNEEYAQSLNFIDGMDVYNFVKESGYQTEMVDYSYHAAKDGNWLYLLSRKL